MNPDKGWWGENGETGSTPFLFPLSQLDLELGAHCSRRRRLWAGVCVLTGLSYVLLGFLPGDTWDPEKEENCEAVQPQNEGLDEWDASQLSLI